MLKKLNIIIIITMAFPKFLKTFENDEDDIDLFINEESISEKEMIDVEKIKILFLRIYLGTTIERLKKVEQKLQKIKMINSYEEELLNFKTRMMFYLKTFFNNQITVEVLREIVKDKLILKFFKDNYDKTFEEEKTFFMRKEKEYKDKLIERAEVNEENRKKENQYDSLNELEDNDL